MNGLTQARAQSAHVEPEPASKTVTEAAEYIPGKPVFFWIDCGTSRHTGAVFMQTARVDKYRVRFTCFGDYLSVDKFSEENVLAILARVCELSPNGSIEQVWLDPAGASTNGHRFDRLQRVCTHFRRTTGVRKSARDHRRWTRSTGDTLRAWRLVDTSRCAALISAPENYMRASIGGDWAGFPAANQSPAEDMCDAARYLIRGVQPEGQRPTPVLNWVPVNRVF